MPLIIWSSVEMAVTMVCIGIPVTMPLWRRMLGKSNSLADRKYRKYERHDENSDSRGFELSDARRPRATHVGHIGGSSRLGLKCTQTTDIRATTNESDENILPTKAEHTTETTGSSPKEQPLAGVHVKDEVRVEWSH